MKYIIGLIFCCGLMVTQVSCSKDASTQVQSLPEFLITVKGHTDADTVLTDLAIKDDSLMVIKILASLMESKAVKDHWVSFKIDSAKMNNYNAKYGDGVLLPAKSYFFYKPESHASSGSNPSVPAELNIMNQTKLKGYATYVLPITIQSVDNSAYVSSSDQTVYLVFKTGKPAVILRDDWRVEGFSSFYNKFVATNAIDADDNNTYWTTDLTGSMPQWIEINFNETVSFSGVSYHIPPLLKYPASGGYPTSIQIETSLDGLNWDNKGIFEGNILNNSQIIPTGLTQAKYLRFTVLASVNYSNAFSAIFISGIGLEP